MKNRIKIALIAASFSVLIQGCATAAQKKELVLKRAVFDFKCSAENLSATETSRDKYLITGCGKKGTYLIDCLNAPGYSPSITECRAVPNSKQDIVTGG